MKFKIGTMFLIAIIMTSSNTVFAAAEVTTGSVGGSINIQDSNISSIKIKEIYTLKIKEAKNEKNPETAINNLKKLKLEVRKDSDLDSLDRFDLEKEIDGAIKVINEDVKKKNLSYTKEEIQKLIKINYNNKDFEVSLPRLNSGQKYEYELVENKKTIDSGTTTDFITLPRVKKEDSFELKIKIIDEIYGTLLNTSVNISIKDEAAPKLEYAYIEKGEVVLKFKDDYVLDGKIRYVDKDSSKEKEIKVRNNKFKIDVPSDVKIIIISPFGREDVISLKIDKDNSVIYGDVSLAIKDRLFDNRITRLNNYNSINNLFVGYKDDIIDLKKESNKLILEKYGKTNKEDITFSSDGVTINGYYGELSKAGLSTIKINHSFYNKEELTFFVYVREDEKVFNTNIEAIEIKGKMTTNSKTFIPKDYISVKQKIDGYNPALDFIFLLDGKTVCKIDKEKELKENTVNKYTILDVLTGKNYELNLRYGENTEINGPISFKDVKGNHWAYGDIKELVFKGVVKGYTDGTFKPNNNISIKEFMVMLNRASNIDTGLEVQNFKNNSSNFLSESDWAYIDALSIYRKLALEDLYKIQGDINRSINRGEVAFLINNTLNIKSSDKKIKLTDINNSIHKSHISNLASVEIISGYKNGTFKPDGKVTRAEVASVLSRLIEFGKGDVSDEKQ